MIWLRLRALGSTQLSTAAGRRVLWIAVVSVCGTLLVETPFLLHLAGTSEWQRLVVLAVGVGLVIVGGGVLAIRRRKMSVTGACLVVYSDAAGGPPTRSGWFVTMAIVWPMLLELVWLLSQRNATAPAVTPERQV
jgi:hypothetical protein